MKINLKKNRSFVQYPDLCCKMQLIAFGSPSKFVARKMRIFTAEMQRIFGIFCVSIDPA
jgi:hypothetical protein